QIIEQHLAAQASPAPAWRFNPPPLAPAFPVPPARSAPRTIATPKAKNNWLVPAICAAAVLLLTAAMLLARNRHQENGSLVVAKDPKCPTLKELNAKYVEPPVGQNAATFYSQGFDSLHINNVNLSKVPLLGRGTLPSLGGNMSGSVKSALTGLVQSNRDALQFF